jgi:hypothetical protein
MKPNKRMNRGTLALLALGMFGVGSVASVGLQASAQTPATPVAPTTVSADIQDGPDGGQNDAPDQKAVLPVGGISETQARAAITAKYPGLTIKDIGLEDKNGSVVYSAELSDKTDVIVDAKTGVVSVEASDSTEVESTDTGTDSDGPGGPQDETSDTGTEAPGMK